MPLYLIPRKEFNSDYLRINRKNYLWKKTYCISYFIKGYAKQLVCDGKE